MSFVILSSICCGISILLTVHSPFWILPSITSLFVLLARSIDFLRQSRTDALTGLRNLRALADTGRRYQRCNALAVYYFDLDNLKEINDSRGHAAGDQLLLEMARLLKAKAGSTGEAYRIGGDEFLLIQRHWNPESGLTPEELSVFPATWGVAFGSGDDLEELIRQADRDLYRKRNIDQKAAGA